jgi:PAS domain S-box-containing protein
MKVFYSSANVRTSARHVTVKQLSVDSTTKGWEKTLGRDRKQFNMFFERMLDGFAYHKIILDRAGKPVDYIFIEINHAFEVLTGLKREKIIGKKVTEVLKGIEDDPADWIGVYGRVAVTCESVEFENYAAPLDKWFKIFAYCPEKGYFVAMFEDITERKRAQDALKESEQRWATTVSSIGDAVITTDLAGKINFMNHVAEELTGWTLTEAQQKPLGQVFRIINEQSRVEVENPVTRVLKENRVFGLANHTILVRKNGVEIPIDDSGAPIKEKDGKVTGVVLIFRDIAERKKAEEKIAQQALMIANANDAIIGYDLGYKVTFWNKAAEQLYGYKTGEAIGKGSVALLRPDYVGATRDKIIKSLEKSGHIESESIRHTKDGRSLNIEAHVVVLRNEIGAPIGYVSVDRDITERKKAEEALKRMNDELEERVQQRTAQVSAERQRLYNVLETLPAYVILLDKDYRVPFSNKFFRETFGDSHGRRCHEYLFNKDHECENCETYKVYRQNKPQHWYWTGPNGRDYDIYDFPFPEANGNTLILEMGIDITERKKAERQVQAASLYARSLIEASLDPLVTISAEGKITDVNKATEEATGCPREQLIGSDFSEYFTEPENARAGYTKVFNEGYVIDYPLVLKHKSGKTRDVLYNAAVYRNAQGEIQGVFAAARDITERKRAEAELKRYQENLEELVRERTAQLQDSEQRFAKAFHSSPAAMTIARLPDGVWVDVNDSFLKMTEYSRAEIVGHKSTELGMFKEEAKERSKLMENLCRNHSVSNVELGAQTKSGKRLRLLFSGVLVNLNGQDHIIAMQIDITERARLKEKLEENAIQLEEYANQMEQLAKDRLEKLKDSERLATIGATAGMVGHDIRNPLQSILSELYLAKTELPAIANKEAKANLSESIANIENDISYINKIVQDLQDFAKPLKPVAKITDLEEICEELLQKVNVPKNIEATYQISPDAKRIITDPDMLKRIIANLITNAVQAMPDGGNLTIRAYKQDQCAIITVEDTGVGIPEEVRPKLFSPLFTTKSKGQGFGLAVVKRTTEALGGTVAFESTVGKGTAFIINLPKQE